MSNQNDEMPVIPATEGDVTISRAGIYLLQPIRITVWKDSNGIPRKDANGNPGLLVTFKDVKGGALISTGFYYSELPLNDPRRQDDSLRCKSEFQLANLKSAMGFKINETIQPQEFMQKKVWAAIKEVQTYTPEGDYVKSSFDIIKKFHPYLPDSKSLGKPSILGDPATDPDGKPTGDFVEVRTSYQGTGSAQVPEKKMKPTSGPPDTSWLQADVVDEPAEDKGAAPTLPQEETKLDEPPDY